MSSENIVITNLKKEKKKEYMKEYDKGDNYDIMDIPIYETESLTEAVQYCYNLDKDFIVRTYAEWEMREMLDNL